MQNYLTYDNLAAWVSDSNRAAALRAVVPMESAETFDGLSLIRPAVYAGDKRPGGGNTGPCFELLPMKDRDGQSILVITIASREKQAKTMSLMMRRLHDDGRGVPAILGYGWIGGRRSENKGEVSEVIDSFDAPNRISDIVWAQSSLLDDQSWTPETGSIPKATTPWLDSAAGSRVSVRHDISPLVLVEMFPTAALFGFDPRASVLSGDTKEKKVGPPVIARPRGRVCQAAVRGVLSSPDQNADWSSRVSNWGHRGTRSARFHPSSNFNVDDDGRIVGGESTGKKPSEVGLGNVPFAGNLDVVPVGDIRMDMSISLSALRCDDYGEASTNARALLAALALRCMTELAVGGSIRAACTLIGSESVHWELVGPGQKESFVLDPAIADQLLDHAIERFAGWDSHAHKVWVADDVANWLTRDHRQIVEPDVAESPPDAP